MVILEHSTKILDIWTTLSFSVLFCLASKGRDANTKIAFARWKHVFIIRLWQIGLIRIVTVGLPGTRLKPENFGSLLLNLGVLLQVQWRFASVWKLIYVRWLPFEGYLLGLVGLYLAKIGLVFVIRFFLRHVARGKPVGVFEDVLWENVIFVLAVLVWMWYSSVARLSWINASHPGSWAWDISIIIASPDFLIDFKLLLPFFVSFSGESAVERALIIFIWGRYPS